ncbi:MAG TPA: hypothetical protein VGS04_01590, partial [Nitrososphaerales archaeon]|nr:hypothetical protein [Nitrososphaerales archaeon]
GFAVYHNQTILTDCGAGGTVNACPQHPTYLYSPAFTAVEQHLNITTGYGGLPEGVLPTPDHDHIIDSAAGGANIPWDVITVLVFDPNILPNPVTGACSQVVPSSLTNATANCLTSLSALQAAFATSNPDIAAANAGNPIWQTLGGPTTQVVIPGDSAVSQINNDNGNLNVYFAVGNSSPYPPTRSLAGAVGLIAAVSLLGLVAWRRAELTNLVTGRGGKRPDSAAEMKSG